MLFIFLTWLSVSFDITVLMNILFVYLPSHASSAVQYFFLTHIIQLLFVLCPFISLYGINTLSYLTKHKAFSPTNVCLPSSGQTSSFQQLSNLLYLLLAVTFTKEHPTMNG